LYLSCEGNEESLAKCAYIVNYPEDYCVDGCVKLTCTPNADNVVIRDENNFISFVHEGKNNFACS